MLNTTAQIQMSNYGEFRGQKTCIKYQCFFGSCVKT